LTFPTSTSILVKLQDRSGKMTDKEIMTDYEKSIRRGELMVARYQMEHPTYDRVADLLTDLQAYCEHNGIHFADEVQEANCQLDAEKLQKTWHSVQL